MKQTVRLTESELRKMIDESVEMVINEAMQDEGWLGDKWNQAKSAAGTMLNKQGGDLGQRFNKAKKNWTAQGELNDIGNLRKQLEDLVDKRGIDPNTTIAQLIGGKYNNNKFGTMSGMMNNRKTNIQRRGGNAY